MAHRLVGGPHVSRHLHVRDVQGVTNFVEQLGLAVFRQLILHVEPRCLEQVAQGVLELVAIKPALRGATIPGRGRLVLRRQRRCQGLNEVSQFGRRGPAFFLGRHLSRLDAVVDADPGQEVGRIGRRILQRGQVEIAFLVHVVVAARAMRVGERSEIGTEVGGEHSAGEQSDQQRPQMGGECTNAVSRPRRGKTTGGRIKGGEIHAREERVLWSSGRQRLPGTDQATTVPASALP